VPVQADHEVVSVRRQSPGRQVRLDPVDALSCVRAEALRAGPGVAEGGRREVDCRDLPSSRREPERLRAVPAPASSAKPGRRSAASASRCAFGGRRATACVPSRSASDQRRSQESRSNLSSMTSPRASGPLTGGDTRLPKGRHGRATALREEQSRHAAGAPRDLTSLNRRQQGCAARPGTVSEPRPRALRPQVDWTTQM
jgi:hypothetical protein